MLPIGGSAQRIFGLPKFMLPVSEKDSLIRMHVKGALAAGVEQVVIIGRTFNIGLLTDHLLGFKDVTFVALSEQTATMNETLVKGISSVDYASDCIVALADTFYLNYDYQEIYAELLSAPNKTLGLFPIRSEQFGKLGQVSFDNNGLVLDVPDKNPECKFPFAWGNMKVPIEFIRTLDIELPHIGYSVRDAVVLGESFSTRIFNCSYFDCGTFAEYQLLLKII